MTIKTKIITLNELKEGNHRLCLSANRAVGQCYKCPQYHTYFRHNLLELSERQIEKFKSLGYKEERGYLINYSNKCESAVENEEYNALVAERLRVMDKYDAQMKDIAEKIKEIES
jgi:hypothetical protein